MNFTGYNINGNVDLSNTNIGNSANNKSSISYYSITPTKSLSSPSYRRYFNSLNQQQH